MFIQLYLHILFVDKCMYMFIHIYIICVYIYKVLKYKFMHTLCVCICMCTSCTYKCTVYVAYVLWRENAAQQVPPKP